MDNNLGNSSIMLVVYAAVWVWIAVRLFFDGFKKLRRKRFLEDMPSSKIHSIAMGFVELQGKAEPYTLILKAPLTNHDCVFYCYLIEQLQKIGTDNKHSTTAWVRIAGDTSPTPFYLNDGTGKVLVNPKGAEIKLKSPDFYFNSWSFSGGGTIPANLVKFMDQHNIKYKLRFGDSAMRFTEWVIVPNDSMYVVGTAVKNESFMPEYLIELNKMLNDMKKNPEQMKIVNANSEDKLNMSEWQAALKTEKNKLIEEELAKASASINENALVIQQGSEEETFIISEKSEEELLRSLSLLSFTEIFGGAVMGSVLIYVLILVLLLK